MNKAFNFLIIAAVILGALCIFLITKYVDARVKQARESAPSREIVMKNVLVAKENITVGSKFTTFNTTTKAMPEDLIPESAVTELNDLEGKLSLFLIPQDDMILTSKIGEPNQLPKASTVIDAGKRLVTIGVNDESASGFTIKNGDYVDLMGIFPIGSDMLEREDPPIGNILGVTFLQKVKVFDIIHGNETAGGGEEERDEDNAANNRRMARGTTATFEVTPMEAEVILAASAAAEGIFMLLRRYDDDAVREQPSSLHKRLVERLTGNLEQEIVEVAPATPPPAPQPKKLIF